MAIYRYDPETRKREKLTPSQIKRNTMRAMGLDPANAQDNRTYRQRYDVIRKRLKNYNTLTGKETVNISPAEFLYSITQRRNYSEDLTITQENVLATLSINSKTFNTRLAAYDVRIIQPAIEAAERVYNNFINNSREGLEYQNWMNEPVKEQFIKADTGEIISEAEAKNLTENEVTKNILTRRSIITPEEVWAKLKELANTLHARQRATYNASKSMYASSRDVGSW